VWCATVGGWAASGVERLTHCVGDYMSVQYCEFWLYINICFFLSGNQKNWSCPASDVLEMRVTHSLLTFGILSAVLQLYVGASCFPLLLPFPLPVCLRLWLLPSSAFFLSSPPLRWVSFLSLSLSLSLSLHLPNYARQHLQGAENGETFVLLELLCMRLVFSVFVWSEGFLLI